MSAEALSTLKAFLTSCLLIANLNKRPYANMRRIHTLRIETIVRANLSSETNQFRFEIMLYLPQVDEEEKPDLSPFLEDEGDNDWVL